MLSPFFLDGWGLRASTSSSQASIVEVAGNLFSRKEASGHKDQKNVGPFSSNHHLYKNV